MTTSAAASQLAADLRRWAAPDVGSERLRQECLALLSDRGATALRRDGGAEHVTASCFILSTDLRHTVLAFHRRGRFWAQTGGHVEPEDASVPAAALREGREESGLTRLKPVPDLLDLDRHELGDRFGACRMHRDVGCVALAGTDEDPRVSEESEDVAWFPIDDLPSPTAPSVRARLARFRDAVRAT